MSKILLVNPALPPSKRRGKKPAKKRKPLSRGKKPMAKAKRKTTRKKRAVKKYPVMGYVTSKKARIRRRKLNPVRARRRGRVAASQKWTRNTRPLVRRRRNPIKKQGMIMSLLKPSATAAAGALMLDVAWAYLPVPLALKTGKVKHLSKAVGAIGMVWLAEQVTNKKTAQEFGIGALAVIMHQAAREVINTVAPDIKMDGYLSGYVDSGMGYISPAPQVGGNTRNPRAIGMRSPNISQATYMRSDADMIAADSGDMAGYIG